MGLALTRGVWIMRSLQPTGGLQDFRLHTVITEPTMPWKSFLCAFQETKRICFPEFSLCSLIHYFNCLHP